MLDWRVLAKLKSTYTDALPAYIHPETGRVHTSYAMAVASTGRRMKMSVNFMGPALLVLRRRRRIALRLDGVVDDDR